MLPVLYQLFPNDFHRLVEVFGGGAAVIFGREPGRCEEIYNDYNGNLVTLFWCVKNRPLALMTELNFLPLNSRQEFEVLRKFLREEEFTDAYLREELELCERFFLPPEREELREIILKKAEMSDVRRAAAFYKVIRYSYAGSGTSFGGKPVDIRRGLHQIWECSRRLAEVVIEHQSYEALIPRFNDPATLLYVDPPYYQAECYEVSFGLRDHYRLRELIGQTKSRVVLSYNDCPFIRDLYRDFWVVAVRRNNPMAKVLVLSPDILRGGCWSRGNQLWLALDGSGCSPGASDKPVRCVCLWDDEIANRNRSEFIGVLKEEYLPNWAREKLEQLRPSAQEPQLSL